MHLTNFDTQIGLNNNVNKYIKEKDVGVFEDNFEFEISIKDLATIDDKINNIIENYEPKTKIEIEDKSC